jgi:hypothetical protein
MVLIPPPSIAEMPDQTAVGSSTALAASLRTAEADDSRELGPVNRVEPAILAADRHRFLRSSVEKLQNEYGGLYPGGQAELKTQRAARGEGGPGQARGREREREEEAAKR